MDSIGDNSLLSFALWTWDQLESSFAERARYVVFFSLLLILLRFGNWKDVGIAALSFIWTHVWHEHAPFGIIRGTSTWIGLGFLGILWSSAFLIRAKSSLRCTLIQKSYLLSCRITHTRSSPIWNSFSYPALFAVIPVQSDEHHGELKSTDAYFPSGRITGLFGLLYSVRSADHLDRDCKTSDLRGKLDKYLTSQGEDPKAFPHAYLVTSPRFMGRRHFNPVSLWYLYSTQMALSAILIEMHNIFGEMHTYLVHCNSQTQIRHLTRPDAQDVAASRARLEGSWAKTFHVSLFNSRKGTYSLLAWDIWDKERGKVLGIDTTLSLFSSRGDPKMVVRLTSETGLIDPSMLSLWQKVAFLRSRSWASLLNTWRTFWQYSMLFFKRNLHIWYRPEPLNGSIARHANRVEAKLEAVFRAYLGFLVEQSSTSVTLKYTSSGIADQEVTIFQSASARSDPEHTQTLEFNVLTPKFYTRFVGYAHDTEAIFCELAESCTVWVDKPDLLPEIFMKKPSPPLHTTSAKDFIAIRMIQYLRRRPKTIRRPMKSSDTAPSFSQPVDIRGFRMSSMDAFAISSDNSRLKSSYTMAAIQTLLADRFLCGSTQSLLLLGTTSRALCCWLLVSYMADLPVHTPG